jgi:lantibiotic modifying enzyme
MSMPTRSSLVEPPFAAAFLETARSIGDRLVATAVWDHDRCNWTGDEIEPVAGAWQVVHRAVDGGLYSGSAGIGRFLACLWAVTGGTYYRSTAVAALRRALDTAEQSPSHALWNGGAGIACATLEVGGMLREPALATDGVSLARRIATCDVPQALTQKAAGLDLISGLAGTLAGLVYVARRVDDANISEACEALVNRLLTAARKQAGGWSWPMHESDAPGAELCGLAHGASGVALALMEAHALAPNPALRAAAWRGIDYENCWFDPGQSNWPDLRTQAGARQTPGGQPPRACRRWCGPSRRRARVAANRDVGHLATTRAGALELQCMSRVW